MELETNVIIQNCRKEIAKITFGCQPDFQRESFRTMYASYGCIETVLFQKDNARKSMMIHALPEKLDNPQMNYFITDEELLAVVKSIFIHSKSSYLGEVHLRNGSKGT